KAELVETAERGEGRVRERRMVRVEVFRPMGSVRTSILEDLDVYPRTNRWLSPTPSTAKSPLSGQAVPTFDQLTKTRVEDPIHRAEFIIGAAGGPALGTFLVELNNTAQLGIEVGCCRVDPRNMPNFSDTTHCRPPHFWRGVCRPGECWRWLDALSERSGIEILTPTEIAAG
ncbi:hypothetical protein, partial [Brevibacterium luteolum]|uniref:hypothetical protein n=1 Tax=Brevibacterium luteolum TaxID=199591 RepID=UPI001CA4B663